MSTISELRPSPIAGTWYSSDPKQLREQIDAYLNQASLPDINGKIIAVIAPHAGYRYSGRTAGFAFRSVKGMQYDLVAVISPLHTFYQDPLITSAHQGYETPLGPVWIDHQSVTEVDRILRQENKLGLTRIANDSEHSLEIELPFLQRAIHNEFKLLPVMIHSRSQKIIRQFGSALSKVLLKRSSLLVASTDLSHFYPDTIAKKLDDEMLHQIASFSPEGVLSADSTGTGLACGAAAVAAVLWASQDLGANAVEIIHHSTSADETGDRTSVVGYGAAVVLKR